MAKYAAKSFRFQVGHRFQVEKEHVLHLHCVVISGPLVLPTFSLLLGISLFCRRKNPPPVLLCLTLGIKPSVTQGPSIVVYTIWRKAGKMAKTSFPAIAGRNQMESDVIVAMLDTGFWPEADSFKDDGFSPPPAKWKGSCDSKNFTCNNKLIGARFYNTEASEDDELSATDTEGHSTHTASTVAGRAVTNASMLGLGNGTARGGTMEPMSDLGRVVSVTWSPNLKRIYSGSTEQSVNFQLKPPSESRSLRYTY